MNAEDSRDWGQIRRQSQGRSRYRARRRRTTALKFRPQQAYFGTHSAYVEHASAAM